MSIKVLISGAGGSGTIEIIRTLKETDRYYIIAIDAFPYSFGFKMADVSYIVPFANSPRFYKEITLIIEREDPDYVIPLVDEEIPIFHALSEHFNYRVVAPTPHFCRMALDKWFTHKTLLNHSIPTPKSWLSTDINEIEYPAVIKPRRGRGSRGLAYLTQKSDLKDYLNETEKSTEEYIVQEQIKGREYTVSVVVTLNGSFLGVVPKEVKIKRGITLVGVTRKVPRIASVSHQIQNCLKANGPFNVQLILDDKGNPYIFEVNPRYSTTVALTIASGVNEVDLVIRHAEGEKVSPFLNFTTGLMMIRYYTQIYEAESKIPFSNTLRISIEKDEES